MTPPLLCSLPGSSIASSLLRSHGFRDVSDLIGGYGAWAASNIPVSLPSVEPGDVDPFLELLVELLPSLEPTAELAHGA